MTIFYAFFIILTLCCVLDFYKIETKAVDDFIFFILCSALFFTAATRVDVGWDYPNYETIFLITKYEAMSISEIADFFETEPGFAAYVFLMQNFSFYAFIFISAVICVIPKVYFIYKLNRNKYLMLLGYYASSYIFFDISGIKQAISLSILIFSYKYIIKRRFLPFISVVFAASLFHSSAAFLTPLFFVGEKKFHLKIYAAAGILAWAFSVFNVSDMMQTAVGALNISFIVSKFDHYVVGSWGDLTSSLIKRIFVLFVLLCLLLRKNETDTGAAPEQKGEYFWLSMNAYTLSILLFSMLLPMPWLAGRGLTCLYLFQIGCFAYFPIEEFDPKRIILYALFIIMMFAAFYGPVSAEGYGDYTSWLF
ncbi:MAG: EpsG family protein [Synergistes sp.]|nr:EpsG family protein [Synergistes sp.]